MIGYNEEEDRRRHTVTERGIVVVTKEDEPFIGAIGEEALRNEAEFDARGRRHNRDRDPDVRIPIGKPESRRHDADDQCTAHCSDGACDQ